MVSSFNSCVKRFGVNNMLGPWYQLIGIIIVCLPMTLGFFDIKIPKLDTLLFGIIGMISLVGGRIMEELEKINARGDEK
jgi:hypothetical protein